MFYFLFYFAIGILINPQIKPAFAQTSTASWQYPLNERFTVNVIDTVVLQWTSNFKEAWLMMWCQRGPGDDVSLGSEFQVQPNGSFGYVMFSENPAQRQYPVACHAQLVVKPKETGVDAPSGITWTSRLGVEAKTFALKASTVSSSVVSSRTSSSRAVSSSSTVETPPSASNTASSTSSGTTSSTELRPGTQATTPSNQEGGSEGLSTAAKIGIGVAVAVGTLVILGLVLFIKRQNKTRREPVDQISTTHELGGDSKKFQELDARNEKPAELEDWRRNSKAHKSRLYELA